MFGWMDQACQFVCVEVASTEFKWHVFSFHFSKVSDQESTRILIRSLR
jgi:hypothetical protein